MKKKLILIVVILLVILVGCGANFTSSDSDQLPDILVGISDNSNFNVTIVRDDGYTGFSVLEDYNRQITCWAFRTGGGSGGAAIQCIPNWQLVPPTQ